MVWFGLGPGGCLPRVVWMVYSDDMAGPSGRKSQHAIKLNKPGFSIPFKHHSRKILIKKYNLELSYIFTYILFALCMLRLEVP